MIEPLYTFAAPGAIRNLRATPAREPFAANVAFDLEDVNEESFRVGLYLNGALARILPPGVYEATVPVFGVTARIDAVLIAEHEAPPDLRGHFGASSAFLQWPAITDSDLAAVRVYRSTSTTGGKLTDPVLVDTITERHVAPLSYARPDSGAAHGRLTAWGSPPAGFTGNGVLTLTIEAENTLEWSGLGSTGALEFDHGATVLLPFGLNVRFEDPAEDYVSGDTYSVRIGVPNSYQTGTLDEGIHFFGHVPVDMAGNAPTGDIDASAGVEIEYEPGPVTGAAITYDTNTDSVQVTWSDPADIDLAGIAVYTNYDPTTHTLLDYVDEGTPNAVIAPGVEQFSISDAELLEGTLRVYLRPRDTHTNENSSIEMLTLTLPPTAGELGTRLGAILLLEATPGPEGDVAISWSYLYQPGDAATAFAFWVEPTPIDFTEPPYGTFSDPPATYPLASFSAVVSGGAHGTTYYVGMRATDGTRFGPAATASVVVDALPPAVAGITRAVPN